MYKRRPTDLSLRLRVEIISHDVDYINKSFRNQYYPFIRHATGPRPFS